MPINLLNLLHEKIARDGDAKVTAKDLGCSPSSISNWKRGHEPSLAVLQRLLDEYVERNPPEDYDIGSGKTLILMPILRHVEGRTHATLNKALAHYGRDQVDVLYQFGTEPDRARNMLVDRALNTDAKRFIFCDADAVIPCGYGPYLRGMGYDIPDPNAGLNAIARLLSSPPEQRIVSALCFGRRLPLMAACSSGVAGGPGAVSLVQRRTQPGETGTEPQDWVGMHFCMVDRTVFEELRAKDKSIKPKGERDPWGYFMKESPEQSEDAAMCLKAKRIGIQSYVDTTLRVGHVMQSVV